MPVITLRGKKITKVGHSYAILIPKAIVENTDNLPVEGLFDFDIEVKKNPHLQISSGDLVV